MPEELELDFSEDLDEEPEEVEDTFVTRPEKSPGKMLDHDREKHLEAQINRWAEVYGKIGPWSEDAKCAEMVRNGTDPDTWFPRALYSKEARVAVTACFSCPVRRECLEYATATDEPGVWGGWFQDARRNTPAEELYEEPNPFGPDGTDAYRRAS